MTVKRERKKVVRSDVEMYWHGAGRVYNSELKIEFKNESSRRIKFEDLYDSVEHSEKLWLALSRYGAV